MDTETAFAQRRQESDMPVTSATTPDAGLTLAVKATYLLSEEGRKASLIAGGDGRAVQHITVEVPTNRLHLVSVDAEGVARLKLRPRYQLDGDQQVMRIDAASTYDTPPAIDDLFREAAKNHQLERAYQTERHAAKLRRREAYLERRTQVAQVFLSDPTQRALVHPPPTPKRCYLTTEHGRVAFDASSDEAPARNVPLEAHRRFRTDLRARHQQNQQQRAEQLALHEEKKHVISEWIATRGTPEQQARQAAGVLPVDEVIDAMTDEAFATLADRPRYIHDGLARLQTLLRQLPGHAEASVTRDDLVVTSANAETMTAAEWALVQEFQPLLPEATVTLRMHKLAWRRDIQMALPPVFGVLVTQRVGPFTLRREYAAQAEER